MNIYDHMPMQFIKYATERGIELTLEKDCINLNTGMKSQLQLYWVERESGGVVKSPFPDGQYIACGRYDARYLIEDFSDLYHAIRRCDHNGYYDGHSVVCGNLAPILNDCGFGDLDDEPFA